STLKSPSYTKSVSWQHYLGAVCFTLFSIVSILEAGSAKK
ncbi:DUF2776 family protein, partial [Shigella boydii]